MKKRTCLLLFCILTLILCLGLTSCSNEDESTGFTRGERPASTARPGEMITLSAPTGLAIVDDVLTWSPVEGADGYTVICEGKRYKTATESLDILGLAGRPGNECSFSVIANGVYGVSIDSAPSDSCSYISTASSEGIGFIIPEDSDYYVAYAKDPSKLVGKIYIPGEYDGQTVGGIMSYGFEQCTDITDVIIDHKIERIGDGAFEGCTELRRISLPDALSVISPFAFADCVKLTSLKFPKNMTAVAGSILAGCHACTSLTIDSDNRIFRVEKNCLIRNINDELILYAGGNRGALPASVKSIGAYAFYRSSVEHVELNEGITKIGEYAFSESSIKAPVLPSTLTSIECEAFSYCKELTRIVIHKGVVRIGKRAFYDCPALSFVSVSGSVKLIEEEAFANLKKATVMLSSQVAEMEDNVFTGNDDVVVYVDLNTESNTTWPIFWGTPEIESRDYYLTWKGMAISYSANCSFEVDENEALYVTELTLVFQSTQSGVQGYLFDPGAYGVGESNGYICFCDPVSIKGTAHCIHYCSIYGIPEGIPSPVREGYTFLGWALEEGGPVVHEVHENGRTLTREEIELYCAPDSHTTLYAVWEKN